MYTFLTCFDDTVTFSMFIPGVMWWCVTWQLSFALHTASHTPAILNAHHGWFIKELQEGIIARGKKGKERERGTEQVIRLNIRITFTD